MALFNCLWLDKTLFFHFTQGYKSRSPSLGKVLERWSFLMTYFVGIDIAKFFHVACILDHHGQVITQPFQFDNSREGFDLLLSSLSNLNSNDLIIGFEGTAHYHENLHHFLSQQGFSCQLINPLVSSRFRSLNIRNAKTDRIDASSLALYLQFHHYNQEESFFVINELTYLCREHQHLKTKSSRELIRLNVHLDRVFPEIVPLFSKLNTHSCLNFLKRFSTAQEIKTTRIDKLYNTLNQLRKFRSMEQTRELKALANQSVGYHSEAVSLQVKQSVYQIELLNQQIEEIESLIIQLMKDLDSPILQIKGLGYIHAAYILTAIGNINRFDSPCKVVAYAGLDPIIRQSGQFKARKTRMSKRGNRQLRYALIWSAYNVSKHTQTLNTYYSKKRDEGKSHYNALGHCAKKLVNYIFYILTNPEKEFVLN